VPTVLEEIIAGVRQDLTGRMARTALSQLLIDVNAVPPPLDPMPSFRSPGLSVVAEIKRRSPSKGGLATIADPATLAQHYASGGAAAISVLTEERRFGGSLNDLSRVRAAVDVPVLRKDFMIDEYQFYEARACGADLVLLIVAALDDQQLRDFYQLSSELKMTALVEVHDEAETERALAIGASLIGINARDLKSLTVAPETFARLVPMIPPHVVKVAESGIAGSDDAERYASEGADVVLVGESLVRHGQPQAAVAAMTGLYP
jgi:indole-3-glycerol phosphate synthase